MAACLPPRRAEAGGEHEHEEEEEEEEGALTVHRLQPPPAPAPAPAAAAAELVSVAPMMKYGLGGHPLRASLGASGGG